ncbi:hypothetical protein Aglo01_51110 [Actinokineospora globicatena]|nr:hypothetical protein Aglo01_51110 [Actinokineospora globicatena]GLW87457.1 hypothetical protein Aglo02_50960 [Actinokineospora globicatena]
MSAGVSANANGTGGFVAVVLVALGVEPATLVPPDWADSAAVHPATARTATPTRPTNDRPPLDIPDLPFLLHARAKTTVNSVPDEPDTIE